MSLVNSNWKVAADIVLKKRSTFRFYFQYDQGSYHDLNLFTEVFKDFTSYQHLDVEINNYNSDTIWEHFEYLRHFLTNVFKPQLTAFKIKMKIYQQHEFQLLLDTLVHFSP